MGIAKDGTLKDSFARGIELVARQTLFAEGCRGSCSEELIEKFGLRRAPSPTGEPRDVQTYGLGVKEVWQVPPERFRRGHIQHTLGWPLQTSPFSDVFGGTFLYHMEPNLVLMGMVVGLDYTNPYMNPYKEFQVGMASPASYCSCFLKQVNLFVIMSTCISSELTASTCASAVDDNELVCCY